MISMSNHTIIPSSEQAKTEPQSLEDQLSMHVCVDVTASTLVSSSTCLHGVLSLDWINYKTKNNIPSADRMILVNRANITTQSRRQIGFDNDSYWSLGFIPIDSLLEIRIKPFSSK